MNAWSNLPSLLISNFHLLHALIYANRMALLTPFLLSSNHLDCIVRVMNPHNVVLTILSTKKHLLVKKFYCLFINFLSKNSLTSAKPGLSCHFGRADWITICTGQMCIAMAFMPWSCQFYNCLFWSELLLSAAAAVKVWMLGNRKQINKYIISTLTQWTLEY